MFYHKILLEKKYFNVDEKNLLSEKNLVEEKIHYKFWHQGKKIRKKNIRETVQGKYNTQGNQIEGNGRKPVILEPSLSHFISPAMY